MQAWFGGKDLGESDHHAHAFLESRGYTIDKGWLIHLPTPAHSINNEEWACICFLIDEWDYGIAPRTILHHFDRYA
jgi:hypothetical protein